MIHKLKYRVFKKLISKFNKKTVKYGTDFITFAISFFFAAFFALFTTVLVNKQLKPEDLGQYAYNKSVLELLSVLLTFTVYQSYLRFNVDGVSHVLKRFVYKVTLFAVIMLVIIAIFLTNSFCAALFAFLIIYNERLYFVRSMMDMRSVNILRFLSALITVCIVFSFYCLKISITGNYVLFAYGVGYMYSFFLFRKKYLINDDSHSLDIKAILLFSLPGLGIVVINWFLNLSAQLFLKEYFDFAEVAKLAIAQRALLAIKLFSGMLLMFYPMVYFREIKKKNRSFLKRLRLGMSVLIIGVSLIAFLLPQSVYLLMGASPYLEYVNIFKILIIAECLYTITTFYGTYLSFALKTYISLIIYASGAIFNVLFLFLFLKQNGVIIAAYSILFSNVLISILIFFLSYREESKYLSESSVNDLVL